MACMSRFSLDMIRPFNRPHEYDSIFEDIQVKDADGNLSYLARHQQEFRLKNISLPSLRLVLFETLQIFGELSPKDGRRTSQGPSSWKFQYCKYTVLVKTPSPSEIQSMSTKLDIPESTVVSNSRPLKVSSPFFDDASDSWQPGFEISKTGVGAVEGRIPESAPYIYYVAVCKVSSRVAPEYGNPNKVRPDIDCPRFQIVEIVGANCRSQLRFRDLKYVLSKELNTAHLYAQFMKEALVVINLIRKSKRSASTLKEIPDHHLWSDLYLIPGGSLQKFYQSSFPATNWHSFSTVFRHLICAFPSNFTNWTTDASSKDCQSLLETLGNPGTCWDLMCKSVAPLDNDPNNNADLPILSFRFLSHTCSLLEKQQLFDFYKTEIAGQMKAEGSTAVLVTAHAFAKKLNSKRYSDLFGADPKKRPSLLDGALRELESKSLIVKLSKVAENSGVFPNAIFEDIYCSRVGAARLESIFGFLQHLEKRWKIQSSQEPSECRTKLAKFCGRLNSSGLYCFSGIEKIWDSERFYKTTGETKILNEEQTLGLFSILFHHNSCIIGTPGTGKTLVIEATFEFFLVPETPTRKLTDSDDNDKGGGANNLFRDVGRVVILTHGGCMADGLRERGLGKAQTLCSYIASDHTDAERSKLEAKVEHLIIDEFSNVSDSIASDIYSTKLFPNIAHLAHVFDPLQTGPIEEGSLSTDYLQNFPNSKGYARKRMTSAMLLRNKLAILDDFRALTEESANATMSNLHKTAPSLFDFLIGIMSNSPTGGPDLGITTCLRRKYRFDENALVASNDKLVMLGGGNIRLLYDQTSFVHTPCATVWNSSDFKRLEFSKKDAPLNNQSLVGTIYDKISRCFKESSQLPAKSACPLPSIFMCLTNGDCDDVNSLCNHVFLTLGSTTKDQPFGSVGDLFIRFSEEDKRKLTLPVLQKGSQLLFRKKLKNPLEGKHNPSIITPEYVSNYLKQCFHNIQTPLGFLVKKADFTNKASADASDRLQERTTIEVLDEDKFLCSDPLTESLALLDDLEAVSENLLPQFIRISDEARKTFPKFSPIRNGTSFVFRGVALLEGTVLAPSSQVRKFLSQKQGLLEESMRESISKIPSGKGSRKGLKLVRRSFLLARRDLFRLDYVMKVVATLSHNRWRDISDLEDPGPIRPDPEECYREIMSSKISQESWASAFSRLKGEEETLFVVLIDSKGDLYCLPREFGNVELALKPGWSITVNYAQGKEYPAAALVLPSSDDAEQITRSVLGAKYSKFDRTHVHVAITRAPIFRYFGSKRVLDNIASRNGERLTNRTTGAFFLLNELNK